jgi:ATP-independent RNA helicase DbpA
VAHHHSSSELTLIIGTFAQMVEKILEALRIEALNEMQLASIEANNKSKDVVLLSPTGSGKTLAFLLPVITQLRKEINGVQALIIAPSRELALQIEQVIKAMGTGYKVSCCYGGHSFSTERNSLQPPPAILVGTPGRIADHFSRGTVDGAKISSLVLDEFDKALEMGFQEEMTYIISKIPKVRKRILTSATNLSMIPEFTGVKEPVIINFLDREKMIKLRQKYVRSKGKDKLDALYSLLCMIGDSSSIVFCNHREAVERVSELLQRRGVAHGIFHGGMEQEDRERSLIKFRNGSHRLLITTDLAARGLDIPEIEFVIHYQLPESPTAFTHRNGRTARMNASGTSYLLLAEDESIPGFIEDRPEREELPAKAVAPPRPEWRTLYIAAGKKDKVNKIDVVGLLLQKGKLGKDDVGLIEVKDFSCYVAVKSDKIEDLVDTLHGEKIKNKKVKMEISE